MTPTLLVSLGTSWAVVPEAFHLLPPGPDGFSAVHVLTTTSTKIDGGIGAIRDWFAARHPGVSLTFSRVEGFTDLGSEADHFAFEEVLYRWMLEVKVSASVSLAETGTKQAPGTAAASFRSAQARGSLPHVCLAGGFKTMSAAMQKAAAVLGAAEVFHVLADAPVDTAEAIDDALAKGAVRFIRLGPESGWPQFHRDTAAEYPLEVIATDNDTRLIRAPDDSFRRRLREIVERSHRIAENWTTLADLPFAELAAWSAADLAWLREPLDPAAPADRTWVAALPKIELHCHLGGFATHGDDLAAVRAAATDPAALPPLLPRDPPAGWPLPDRPCGLEPYRKLGDNNGSALLRDPGCLRAQCQRLYAHLLEQNIVYAEIRCSPANYADPARGRSPWHVLAEIRDHFQRCMNVAAVAAGVTPADPPAGGTPASTISPAVAAGILPAVAPAGGTPGSTPASCADRAFHPFSEVDTFTQTWRDLPHRDQPGATVFLTFRLADSLPAERLAQWHEEQQDFLRRHPQPWDEDTAENYRQRFPARLESWLDQAHGSCCLRDPAVADIVEQSLRHFDGERYVLDAYVIMPNHVHVLVKPLPGHSLRSIVHSWKSYSAKRINTHLGRTGTLWQEESFDHLVRSVEHLGRLRHYIADNPSRAGLRSGFRLGHGLCVAAGVAPAVFPAGATPASTACPSVAAGSLPAEPSMPAGILPAVSPAGSVSLAGGTPASTAAVRASKRYCHVNLIIIATRQDRGDYRTAIGRHLSLAVTAAEHWTADTECRVVGVDLAGFEDPSTRAQYFRDDFKAAHRCNLALTAHAGENDDAEGIWSAVLDLNARRLGHALALRESPDLLRTIATRAIAVEMCPYANLQIKGYPVAAGVSPAGSAHPVAAGVSPAGSPTAGGTPAATGSAAPASYPLLDYLRAGVRVTVNTDNIGISAASLTDNLLLAARLCPALARLDVLRLQRHALDAAFVSPAFRARLLERMAAAIRPPGHTAA